MKRIIIVSALILSLALCLFGCAVNGGAQDSGNGGNTNAGLTGDVTSAVNLTSGGLSFYTDGGDGVQLSLENLRLEISLITGTLPTLCGNESEANAIFGVRDYTENGANSHIGYVDLSYKDGKLYVLASDTESLNLAKNAILCFASEEGLIIPENFAESTLFNKNDYRQGKLTVYTEEEAMALPLIVTLMLDGDALGGFSSSRSAYQMSIKGDNYPDVTAVALHAGSTVEVEQASEENFGVATVKVSLGDKERVYTVSFINEDATTEAVIVQKGGAKGTVCFVIDDGTHSTAEFVRDNILAKPGYENVNINFALITKKLATLLTTENENGELVYDIDENGKYKYEEVAGEFDFWRGVLATGNSYIVSHTHTHNPPGENDEGGIFGYKKNDGTWTNTAYLPKGHILAEIEASNQIIMDISGKSSGTMIRAGVGASVSKYFYNLMLDSGVYFAARSNSGDIIANPNQYVFYPDTITNRSAITSYMIEYYASSYGTATVKGDSNDKCLAAGIDKWTGFIDHAVQTGGWASFCIHEIKPDNYVGTGHYIYETQAKALFGHANSYGDDLWVASYDEAAKYFLEWSTATVKAELKDDNVIAVNLVTEETDERLDYALTVKVTVSDSYHTVKMGDKNLEIKTDTDGSQYVLVDVKPGETVLLKGECDLDWETPSSNPMEIN